MQFTCTKENITSALQYVTPLTGKSSHLPILSHVLIQANESGVTLSSTNLEIALTVQLRAKVDMVGSFTVPAKTLFDYISLVTSEQLRFEQLDNSLNVQAGQSSTAIHGVAADEFPVIPEMDQESQAYSLPSDALKQAFSRVLFAAAKNDIRPELSGIACRFESGEQSRLVLASTDSYRLAEAAVPLSNVLSDMQCILPAKTVAECIRLLSLSANTGTAAKDVQWNVSRSQIQMDIGDVLFISRLIDGTYPDYTQIIPQAFQSSVRFPSDVLRRAVKAASLFADNTANALSFALNPEENAVSLRASSTETGEYENTLDVPTEGDQNSIVLNNKYVLEGLQQLGEGDIDMQMNGPDAPCLFQKNGDSGYLYIVMPIRQ